MSNRKLKKLEIDDLNPPGLMIRILRYANEWTAKDLINAMNKSKTKSPKIEPAHISQYEKGQVFPSKPVIDKLCKAFKISPSFLFISQDTHPETIKYLTKLIIK